jgi:membrane protein DedA with SNARE-associated domain
MNILNSLLSFLLLYKYYALFAVVYSSALLLPLPANATLLAVGAFSSQGYFNFWVSLVVAVVANTLGDLTGYSITRIYGERFIRLLRLHKFKFYVQLQDEFRTDAAITVFLTRFASSLSTVANFLAGLVKVPIKIFLFYDFLGNLIEPGAALTIGYIVGNYWTDFSNFFELGGAVVSLGVVMFILFRIYRRMTKKYNIPI